MHRATIYEFSVQCDPDQVYSLNQKIQFATIKWTQNVIQHYLEAIRWTQVVRTTAPSLNVDGRSQDPGQRTERIVELRKHYHLSVGKFRYRLATEICQLAFPQSTAYSSRLACWNIGDERSKRQLMRYGASIWPRRPHWSMTSRPTPPGCLPTKCRLATRKFV